jgi:2-amino-4-hydroxy-6-hydroxymethyldihydropteridine diphosphokinase
MTAHQSQTVALLGLGSNLGDRAATLQSVIKALRRLEEVRVLAVSTFIQTEPVGHIAQPRFLNAAVKLRTSLSPQKLLEACLEIEKQHGRQRTERWGPRTLDIDLLLFGDRIIDEPGLHLPHPRMQERFFVLIPAAEIAAEMRHPLLKQDVRGMLLTLQDKKESAQAHS